MNPLLSDFMFLGLLCSSDIMLKGAMAGQTSEGHVKFVEDPVHSDPLAAHDSHKIVINQQGPNELSADLGLLQEGCEYSVELDLKKSAAGLELMKAFANGASQSSEDSCSTVKLITYDPTTSVMTIHLTADVPRKWTRRLVVCTNDETVKLSITMTAKVMREFYIQHAYP